MTTPLRVGVIGAGANTRSKHIPGLKALDGVEVVAVCNRSRASSQAVADEFAIPVVFDNWWDLVASGDIDAVVIGTWPYTHCRMTVAALEAGKHVMCEARMAMNAREAVTMRAAAQARPDLVAQIVPSPFTLGVDRTIQRLLAEGYLGDLLAIQINAYSNSFLDPDAPLHWRQSRDLSGLNIMSLGIWYEALMRWVGEAVRVTAMGKTFVTMRPDPAAGGKPAAVQIPDHLTVIAEMACGAQATFVVSSVTGLSGAPEAMLFGSRGTVRFSGGVLQGGRQGDSALGPLAVPDDEAGAWRVEEEFVNAIRGQETITHTDFDTGVKYMLFTEAVARSLREGRSVSIDEIAAA